jgi:hypothetical protein
VIGVIELVTMAVLGQFAESDPGRRDPSGLDDVPAADRASGQQWWGGCSRRRSPFGDINDYPRMASAAAVDYVVTTRTPEKAVGEAEGKRVDALTRALARAQQAMFGAGVTARPNDARRK